MLRKFFAPCLSILLVLAAEVSVFSPALAMTAGSSVTPAPKHVCKPPLPGSATCGVIDVGPVASPQSRFGVSPNGVVLSRPGNSAPYTASNLRAAYNLHKAGYYSQTVAIVDAYDDPNAEADLSKYRSSFGLPACTTANGCFRKVNQNGVASPLPSSDPDWSQEISLDLDMVSAICLSCRIILVETNSTSFRDLGAGVNAAATLGANIISNSYGSNSEMSNESSLCSTYYNHPNVAVVASTGDSGPAVQVPAVCPNVVAVGGTSLKSDGTETAWSYAGGGCSAYISKSSWQGNTGCSRRAVADIAAVADPNTGVYVYDTFNASGWMEMGGTSVSAPIISGVYGLASNASSVTSPAQLLWRPTNPASCFNKVPTNSSTKYAYQTGLGTPNGFTCF